ncbi:uncharacterized protein LOC106877732 isoform X15 [Octopus bimaculoides]|uniref:uncharacterized protein LOC106877732 isoform X15 n=1 Tax=Octopus bimaculoides TaxID=37653 RepID=UPI00071E34FE|nr:uncharacterized protein LOC106877732 isoform X15 [Octopus bimaculoides]|eukprot:XP_014782203.1 PREDICTED: uncharacterized protein LOC106877732 isoform X13 [Octopus bimaculoides]
MVFVRKFKGPSSEDSVQCPVRSCSTVLSKFRNLPKHLRSKHRFNEPIVKSIVSRIRNCVKGIEDFCEGNLPEKVWSNSSSSSSIFHADDKFEQSVVNSVRFQNETSVTSSSTLTTTSEFHGDSPFGLLRNVCDNTIRHIPLPLIDYIKLPLAGPSNQVFSGKPENPRRKKIAAATVSSAPVLIPDDSPPQPSPAKIQKKQIDDRRFDEQRFQEQRFQERRFENRRFDDRRQMVNTQVSQMAAKTLQAQMPVQQHMSVAQVSQNITRPVQVLAPPIQISEPKPKPVEKPRPREKRIFVVADHQRCVMSNLASLWKSGKLCDAGIGNGSSTVMVHKVVLSAVCPKLLSVFSTDILSHKFLQVNFPEEVSTEALNAFAEYMYNGLLDIDPDILHQLKIIAKRLDMKEFEQLCDSRLPSTIPQQPASTVTVFGDLSQMQTILSNPPSITVPTVQPSLPSSSITSVTSQSAPSVTTQVIDVKQEISEAELAQVKKDTAAVFGQESEVASLDASKSGNSSGGFVIVPSVKTEPVGPEDDRYGQLNNQSYASTPVSISSRIPGTGLNSTVVSSSEFVLPFSDTTDSNTTNVLQGTSKLKSNVFESSLVSDLSPVSCIVEKMCSQSSPIREDPSKPLNRTITTQSIDNIVTSGSNEGVYPVGLFTAGGDSLPLSSTQVTNVKNIGLYKTDGLT